MYFGFRHKKPRAWLQTLVPVSHNYRNNIYCCAFSETSGAPIEVRELSIHILRYYSETFPYTLLSSSFLTSTCLCHGVIMNSPRQSVSMIASGPKGPSPPSPGRVSCTRTWYLVMGFKFISVIGSLPYTENKKTKQNKKIFLVSFSMQSHWLISIKLSNKMTISHL